MDQQKSGPTAMVVRAGDGLGWPLVKRFAAAKAVYQLHIQLRSAWTFELDLRPWRERF